MRLRAWLAASMLAAVAAPIAAQDAAKPAAGEYGRAAKLEVQVFESANKQVRLEYPKKDWMATPGYSIAAIPGTTLPVVSLTQRKREASIVIEMTKLHQPLANEDITDLFSQLEIDSVKERVPLATDVQAKLVEAGGRRFVILTYGRNGMEGPERVRQYSIPYGADLYRVTCFAAAAQFARYEPVFAHVAATFAVTAGATQ